MLLPRARRGPSLETEVMHSKHKTRIVAAALALALPLMAHAQV
jgi:hypothetical protein